MQAFTGILVSIGPFADGQTVPTLMNILPGDQSKCLRRQGAELMCTMLAYRVNRYQRVFSKEKVKLNFKQFFRTNDRLVSNSNKRNFCLLQKAFDDCLQTIASGEFQKVMRFCLFRSRI